MHVNYSVPAWRSVQPQAINLQQFTVVPSCSTKWSLLVFNELYLCTDCLPKRAAQIKKRTCLPYKQEISHSMNSALKSGSCAALLCLIGFFGFCDR